MTDEELKQEIEKDKKMISDFIKADKAKRRNKKISKKSTHTQSV